MSMLLHLIFRDIIEQKHLYDFIDYLTQNIYRILRLHYYNSVVTRNHLRFTKLYEMKNATLMIVDAT